MKNHHGTALAGGAGGRLQTHLWTTAWVLFTGLRSDTLDSTQCPADTPQIRTTPEASHACSLNPNKLRKWVALLCPF